MSQPTCTLFETDDALWRDAQSHPQNPLRIWTFSNQSFFIGSEEHYILDQTNYCQTAIELALFDIHFAFWLTKSDSTSGNISYNRNYQYHAHLRSRIEDYFKSHAKGQNLTSPPILIPWLWRTFTLCCHTPSGRKTFSGLVKKFKHLQAPNLKGPKFSDWKERLHDKGFSIYFPKWFQIAKTKLGVPDDHTCLRAWQMHIFKIFDISDSNTVSDSSKIGFFTNDEKRDEPWLRIICDPSFYHSWKPLGTIDHQELQKLKIDQWLNDEIIHAYLALCIQKNSNNRIKVLSTWFWSKLILKLSRDVVKVATSYFLAATVGDSFKTDRTIKVNEVLMGLERVLIPIHHKQTQHWLLLEMNVKGKKWVFHDSLKNIVGNKGRMKIQETISSFFSKSHGCDFSDWSLRASPYSPQQIGTNNCGIFTCQFVKRILFKPEIISSEINPREIAMIRRLMTLEFFHNDLRLWSPESSGIES